MMNNFEEITQREASAGPASADEGGGTATPLGPEANVIRAHLEMIAQGMSAYDDGKIEIAWNEGGDAPNASYTYPLSEIDAATNVAVNLNRAAKNVWVGVATRTPVAPNGRCGRQHFYAAGYVVVDIDRNCADVLAKLPVKSTAVVWTGSKPEPRAQAWIKLREPCDNADEYEAAQAALVGFCGGDENAKGAARLMRLAGTVSYPKADKRGRGYITELTRLMKFADAEAVDIVRLIGLGPTAPAVTADVVVGDGNAAGVHGVVYDDQGRICDGRRTWLLHQILANIRQHQEENFDDPDLDGLVTRVEAEFFDHTKVNHDDGKWSCTSGRAMIRRETGYTLSRLRSGLLAAHGLASFNTGVGTEQAIRVAAERKPDDITQLGIFKQQKVAGQTAKSPQKSSKGVKSALLVSAASLTPERVNWLWANWLAAGKLHILAGQPSTGKTTVAVNVAAIISTGGLWPDGTRALAGNVLMWSAEDGIEDTLLPRFKAAGGDDTRMFFVQGVTIDGKPRSFDPAEDMDALTAAASALGSVSLLIVDPVVQAVAGDSHKGNEVRRGLQPLVDFAEDFGCAVLGISHFSKGSAGKVPIERITGSMAFGALARLVWFAAVQEGSEETGADERRVLIRAKSNLGPNGDGFEYGMEVTTVPGYDDISATRIVFGDEIKGGPAALLADIEGVPEDQDALEDAKDFLIDTLKDGKVAERDIATEAMEQKIKPATLKRAKKALGVVSEKSGITGGWNWHLPKDEGDQNVAKMLTPKT